jgi:hypothetical protein
MSSPWWMLWLCFMSLLLVLPLGYGWGVRGWGAPLPSFVQRRRAKQAWASSGSAAYDHQRWGRAGDYVWLVLFIGSLGAVPAFWPLLR